MHAQADTELPTSSAEATFTRILVPIDFSASSRRALATALALRSGMGSEVHLFHLAEQGANEQFLAGIGGSATAPGDLADRMKARLLRFVDNVFPGRAADVSVHVRIGADVVHGIERMAKDVGATLVLLAGRPRQSLFRTDIEVIARDLDGAVMLLWTPEENAPS